MVRIIVISPIKKPISYRLHSKFLSKLSLYSNCKVINAFSKKKGIIIPIEKIIEKYNPNIIILHTHNKHLYGYLKNVNILKIMIAVDYHKKNRLPFYKSNKFDLIVHRGYINEKIDYPHFWLPFSVDLNIFKPNKNKINKICFTGSIGKIYKQRIYAINKLQSENLIDNLGKTYNNYPNIINKYIGCLSSAELNSPYAKAFEIAACESALLTPTFFNIQKFFPSNAYFLYDKSNINKIAKFIINNNDIVKYKTSLLKNDIINLHTDEKRIYELYLNIINFMKGNSLIHKWEIE